MAEDDHLQEAHESVHLTTEVTQKLLGSLDGRLPLLMKLQAATAALRKTADEVANPTNPLNEDTYSLAVTRLNEDTKPVAEALAWITAWGQPGIHEPVVRAALQRLANIDDQHSGHSVWLRLRRWPAAVCLAAVGTSAVDAQREDLLGRMLSWVIVRGLNKEESAAIGLSPGQAIDPGVARSSLGRGRAHTPVDDLIGEQLTKWLVPDLIDSEAQLDDAFDRYQFLAGLVHLDESTTRGRNAWAPTGSFSWRREYRWALPDKVATERERWGDGWPLLAAGLFGSDVVRAKKALDHYRQMIEQGR